MIDKDLDSLLSDVDGSSEYESSREGNLLEKQYYARKGDVNIEQLEDGVDSNQAFRDRIDKIEITGDIMMFSRGVLSGIQEHDKLAKQFRKTLTEFDAAKGVEDLLRKYNYTFIRSIENIEKHMEDYSPLVNYENMRKKARKDYSLVFEGFEEENKIDFLLLKDVFIRLREFNSKVRKEWTELSKSIAVLNLSADAKPAFQSFNAITQSAELFSRKTDTFVAYIADVLSIPRSNHDVLEREILNKIIYHDNFNYAYDSLFRMQSHEKPPVDRRDHLDIAPRVDQSYRPPLSVSEETRESEPAPEQPPESRPRREDAAPRREFAAGIPIFTIKGTRPWNTKEPYIIAVNPERLEEEEADLVDSFLFVDRPVSEEALQGEIKRGMLKFLTDRSLSIRDGYREFLMRRLTARIDDIAAFFDFSDDAKLFAYHLGPSTVHRMTVLEFTHEKIGQCFKYVSGNRVSRFLPQEFIKSAVLDWFEHNVNSFPLQFDSINRFEDIRKAVSRKYYAEVDTANRKLNELIKKLALDRDPKFNRDEYFKTKINEWFTPAAITVYIRFVDRTIFR